MAKFHISNDGNVRACRAASEDSCTAKGLGGRHFDSADEGREAVEKILGSGAPKVAKKETKHEKLLKAVMEATASVKEVEKIHGQKLKEFEKIENTIRDNALGGKVNSNELISDHTRLQAELSVLAKERKVRNDKLRKADQDEITENRRIKNSTVGKRPSPVYPPSYGFSSGGCGGSSGGC